MLPEAYFRGGCSMAAPIGTKARTGEKCPESGVWKVEGEPSTTAPIAKGNTMPPYMDKAVTWILKSYA
jgi:hypothetical protein